MAGGRAEIAPLTGVRGIAAFWVMAGHYLGEQTGGPLSRAILGHSYIAVDLFMILSGFVLAMAYGARCQTGSGSVETLCFLLHRLARIYPLYAATSVLCLSLMLGGVHIFGEPDLSPLSVAANLLMVQAWGWPNNSLNGAAWSISTEWAANLLFPVLAMLLLRSSMRRSVTTAGLAFGGLILYALVNGQRGWNEPMAGAVNWYTAPDALIRCTIEFVLGMFCWRLRTTAVWAVRLGGTPALACTVGSLCVLAMLPQFDIAFVALACILVIGLGCDRSPVAAIFGMRLPYWLGTISFSLYLWHMPLLPLRPRLLTLLDGCGVPASWMVANVLLMAGVLGISAASFRWLERPMQRQLRRRIDGGSVTHRNPTALGATRSLAG